jgi:type VI protein secretion system component VasF
MSHCPGPWRYEMHDGTNYARLYMERSGLTGDAMRGYIGEDNARLIAAAPDLLAACQALLAMESDEDADGAAEQIRDAIEKATGERPQ